jgi:hypothetical protein
MTYTAMKFADKGAAWRVYKKIKDGLRSQNQSLNGVKISGSTVSAEDGLVQKVEEFANKFNFRYKTETA